MYTLQKHSIHGLWIIVTLIIEKTTHYLCEVSLQDFILCLEILQFMYISGDLELEYHITLMYRNLLKTLITFSFKSSLQEAIMFTKIELWKLHKVVFNHLNTKYYNKASSFAMKIYIPSLSFSITLMIVNIIIMHFSIQFVLWCHE